MSVLLSEEAKSLKCGTYRHYKGNLYEVICVGKLESTLEDVVIYRSCVNPEEIWVRPVTDFLQKIEHEGKIIPRFLLVNCQ